MAEVHEQFEDHVIEQAEEAGDYYSLSFVGGMGFGLSKAHLGERVPRAGQTVRLYGRGFGSVVLGASLDGVLLWRETEDEYRQRMTIDAEIRRSAERAEVDANRAERDARVAALPVCFRKRIARFRRNNPDFYWEHEDYEMAACVDAVKIADAFREADNPSDALMAFHRLPWADQKAAVPDLSDGHSGNTFGMAVRLAHHYLTDERLVFADHATIAPLTGCECGCPPVTDDEMREAGYEPFSPASEADDA